MGHIMSWAIMNAVPEHKGMAGMETLRGGFFMNTGKRQEDMGQVQGTASSGSLGEMQAV